MNLLIKTTDTGVDHTESSKNPSKQDWGGGVTDQLNNI